MKKRLLLILMTASLLSAAVKVDLDYSGSAVFLNRGGDGQSAVSMEEIKGDLAGQLTEPTTLFRLYNAAAVNVHVSDRFRIYTRLRHAYSFYADDMYTPFALNRFYADYRGDTFRIRAGRFFATDRTVRHAIDGAALDLKFNKSMPTHLAYGAQAPSVYSRVAAPDFYGRQYIVLRQGIPVGSLGSLSGEFTYILDHDAAEAYQRILAATWRSHLAGFAVHAYGEYRMTDSKLGNSVLSLTRAFGSKLLVNADYRTVLQRDFVIDPENDLYFSGSTYDVLRAGAFYELNHKFGLEVSQLTTFYEEEVWSNTTLQLVGREFGGIGLAYVLNPDGRELEMSARLAHSFFEKLKVEAGLNYITEASTFEDESLNGTGTYLGATYKVLKGLDAGLKIFQMQSPQFDSRTRALFNLNYRVSL